MSSSSLKRKFKTVNLLGALAVLLIGTVLTAHPLYSNKIHLQGLGLGLLCIVGGFWALLSNVWLPACGRCSQFLAEYELSFMSDTDRQQLQTALTDRSVEHLMYVLDNAPVPPIAQPGQTRYTLNLEVCETCKQTARMRLTQVTFDANNQKQEGSKIVTWTEMNSPLIAHVIQRVISRNSASSAMGFGSSYAVRSG
jgi:hypothetical protein